MLKSSGAIPSLGGDSLYISVEHDVVHSWPCSHAAFLVLMEYMPCSWQKCLSKQPIMRWVNETLKTDLVNYMKEVHNFHLLLFFLEFFSFWVPIKIHFFFYSYFSLSEYQHFQSSVWLGQYTETTQCSSERRRPQHWLRYTTWQQEQPSRCLCYQ